MTITFGPLEDAQAGIPGFYQGLPEVLYNDLPGVRRSELRYLSDSPALCAYMRTVPFGTSATLVGEATHCAVYEPREFSKRYVIGPKADLKRVSNPKTPAAQKAYEAWRAENPDTLTKDQWKQLADDSAPAKLLRDYEGEQVRAMERAVWNHPVAKDLLEPSFGWNEVTVLWKDPRTDLLCKARLDRVFEDERGHLVVIDLKTIIQATTGRIKQAWARGMLHLQSAFYSLGVSVASGGVPCEFIFLWLGKEAPHLVRLTRLAARRREIVDTEVKRLLSVYAECSESRMWADRSREIEELDVPRYLIDDAYVGADDAVEDDEEEKPF